MSTCAIRGLSDPISVRRGTARRQAIGLAWFERATGAEVAIAVGLDAALQQLEQWWLLRGRAS